VSSTERWVVCGVPGSGKTTWVEQRRTSGDIVWDADRVANTVAHEPVYPRSPHVVALLNDLRETMLRRIAAHAGCGAYVIIADPVEAQQVATRINAKVHRCEPPLRVAQTPPDVGVGWG
jgi:putative protein kinase ArgK-like GTPase of G3E family